MVTDAVAAEVARRAAAYDAVYARWHVKRITREEFEAANRCFLDGDGSTGDLNGNELQCAFALLDVEHLKGRRVLDYCCGVGRTSIYFALRGAEVWGFDASAEAIRIAQASARLSGVDDRVTFSVMDARALDYPSGWFDAAFCKSALHIVADYPGCGDELARVLKPAGRAVFCEEALGYNPFFEPLRWVRRRKYRACGGRTLRYRDIRAFGRRFAATRIHHFNLLLQLKTVFGESSRRQPWRALLRAARRVDAVLLTAFPVLRPLCGKVVVEYRDPLQAAEAPT